MFHTNCSFNSLSFHCLPVQTLWFWPQTTEAAFISPKTLVATRATGGPWNAWPWRCRNDLRSPLGANCAYSLADRNWLSKLGNQIMFNWLHLFSWNRIFNDSSAQGGAKLHTYGHGKHNFVISGHCHWEGILASSLEGRASAGDENSTATWTI